MVNRIGNEVASAIAEHDLQAREVAPDESAALLNEVLANYGAVGRWPLWDRDDGVGASVQDPNGWKWVPEFVGARACYLFFEPESETRVFWLANSGELARLLIETSAFEFYVTDLDATYLLSFNHHDFLIGFGAATDWVREKKASCVFEITPPSPKG